jgi:hypothetical protein
VQAFKEYSDIEAPITPLNIVQDEVEQMLASRITLQVETGWYTALKTDAEGEKNSMASLLSYNEFKATLNKHQLSHIYCFCGDEQLQKEEAVLQIASIIFKSKKRKIKQ